MLNDEIVTVNLRRSTQGIVPDVLIIFLHSKIHLDQVISNFLL